MENFFWDVGIAYTPHLLAAVSNNEICYFTNRSGSYVRIGAEIFVKAVEKFGKPHHQTVIAAIQGVAKFLIL